MDQGCIEDGMGVTVGADMLSMRDDNDIPAAEVEAGAVNERVSVIKNDYTTQSQSHHPSMVKRAEIEGMGDEEVLCVFTDGVCATHGPATKKWRGGKVWGKKKNGLYGWRYDRKDYWVCEKVRDDKPGGEREPEPTFVFMGASKDRQNPSSKTTTGGSISSVRGRFSDFGKKSWARNSGL